MEYYSVCNNGPSHCAWFCSACNCSSKPCSIPISHVVKVNLHNSKLVCCKLQYHILAAVCLGLDRRHATLTWLLRSFIGITRCAAFAHLYQPLPIPVSPTPSAATPQSASNLSNPHGRDLHLWELSESPLKRIKTNLYSPLQLITAEPTYSCNYLYAAHTVQFAQRQGLGPPGDLTCNMLIVHQVLGSRQIEETFYPWMTKWALSVVDQVMNSDAAVQWQMCASGCFTRMINVVQVDNIQA